MNLNRLFCLASIAVVGIISFPHHAFATDEGAKAFEDQLTESVPESTQATNDQSPGRLVIQDFELPDSKDKVRSEVESILLDVEPVDNDRRGQPKTSSKYRQSNELD